MTKGIKLKRSANTETVLAYQLNLAREEMQQLFSEIFSILGRITDTYLKIDFELLQINQRHFDELSHSNSQEISNLRLQLIKIINQRIDSNHKRINDFEKIKITLLEIFNNSDKLNLGALKVQIVWLRNIVKHHQSLEFEAVFLARELNLKLTLDSQAAASAKYSLCPNITVQNTALYGNAMQQQVGNMPPLNFANTTTAVSTSNQMPPSCYNSPYSSFTPSFAAIGARISPLGSPTFCVSKTAVNKVSN